MSYLIIPVYSFKCDMCDETFDCTPGNHYRSGEQSLLVTATRLLGEAGWSVRGRGASRVHLCQGHKDATQAPPEARKGKCRYCSRSLSLRGDGRVRNHVIKGTGRRCGGSGQVPS